MQKHAKILAAARASLLRGRAAPGIESVARRAGVSKLTIYRHFGSFDALLRDVVHAQNAILMAQADGIPRVSADLRRTLVDIGERLIAFLSGDEGMTLLRVASSRVAHRQGLGKLVFESGPRNFVARLARLLSGTAAAEGLAIDSPREAAEELCGMWLGILTTGLQMQGCPRPTRAQMSRRARRGVDAFLRAYAAR